MPRSATVWWKKQRGASYTDIGGTRHVLAIVRSRRWTIPAKRCPDS
jgi:hypothetical protein